MRTKSLLFSKDARQELMVGVDLLANAVKATLGPKGRVAILGRGSRGTRVTKDGVSVAREINLENPVHHIGAQLVKEAASKTVMLAGDGTTTATVLAQAMLKNIMSYMDSNPNVNVNALKHDVDAFVEKVIEYLTQQALTLDENTPDLLQKMQQVAKISANNDESIGNLVAEAYSKVGKDGVVLFGESSKIHDGVEIIEGMQINYGYVHPGFITNPAKLVGEYENACVFVYDEPMVGHVQQWFELFNAIIDASKSLVIVGRSLEGEMFSTLLKNKLEGNMSVAFVKIDEDEDPNGTIMKDIAIATGTSVIKDGMIDPKDIKIKHLGFAKRVLLYANRSVFVGGEGNPKEIEDRCAAIKLNLENPMLKEEDRKGLERRLAGLKSGIGLISVGGPTDMEKLERKDRVEDAIYAVKAALEQGIVPGGGVALCHAAYALDSLKDCIVYDAIQEPYRIIASNAATTNEHYSLDSGSFWQGYDFNKLDPVYGNMLEMGVIDPLKVVVTALRSAASVATMLMLTDVVVYENPEI